MCQDGSMKNIEAAEQAPQIAASLLDITETGREEVEGLHIQYMSVSRTIGTARNFGASFDANGNVASSWGGGDVRSGVYSDEVQLEAIEHLKPTPLNRWVEPPSSMSKDLASKQALGALVRITDRADHTKMGWLRKRDYGRTIKRVTQSILDHEFAVDITAFVPKPGLENEFGPLLGTNFEYVAKHPDSFALLKPFFLEEQQERITQHLKLSGHG